MSDHVSNASRVPAVHDNKRIQKLLEEMLGKVDSKSRPTLLDENAAKMLIEYAVELSNSIMEASSTLARHRDSNVIEAEDINLILAKKLGIDLPGQQRIKSLHQHDLKSLYTPNYKTAASTGVTPAQQVAAVTASMRAQIPSGPSTGETKKQGVKRKINTVRESVT